MRQSYFTVYSVQPNIRRPIAYPPLNTWQIVVDSLQKTVHLSLFPYMSKVKQGSVTTSKDVVSRGDKVQEGLIKATYCLLTAHHVHPLIAYQLMMLHAVYCCLVTRYNT